MDQWDNIPEYALQPAKAPEVTKADAVYRKEKMISPQEESVCYGFEEDILVPDVKPDMKEIFLMDAEADISPEEKKISPKADDILNIAGTITLQTLYGSEGGEDDPVAVISKVPYKYQWNLNPEGPSEGIFACRIKKLEYMIINERKFRVKAELEFTGKLFRERDLAFFSGLKDERLEMKKQTVPLLSLGFSKDDEVPVDETFPAKDPAEPEIVLKQDYTITENYRQVTKDKIVINGFIFCGLLYKGIDRTGEEPVSVVKQHNERVEFTEFIPIEKEHRNKQYGYVKTFYSGRGLSASVERDEAEGRNLFRLSGGVKLRAELYQRKNEEMITDAYHREKDFECDYTKKDIFTLSDRAAAEISLRTTAALPEGKKASEAFYCACKVSSCLCKCEKGRVLISGTAEFSAFWRDAEGKARVEKIRVDFNASADVEDAAPGQKAICKPFVKTAWADLINEKQIEVSAALAFNVETVKKAGLVFLEAPRFVERLRGREYPVVMVKTKKGETLWDLAKRYRSTEDEIILCNRLQGEAEAGRMLLIVR